MESWQPDDEVRPDAPARRAPTRVLLAVAVVSVAVRPLLPAGSPAEAVFAVATTAGTALAWIGAAGRADDRHAAWRWIAGALTLTCFGDLAYASHGWLSGASPQASLADPLWLGSYVALAVGLVGLGRARTSTGTVDVDAILDSLVVGVIALLLSWELTLADALDDPALSPVIRMLWVVYPVLDVVVLALLVRLAVGTGHLRERATALLVGGSLCWVVADFAYLIDPGRSAARWVDAVRMAATVLVGVAATRRGEGSGGARLRSTVLRAAGRGRMWLFLAPLLVPGLLEAWGHVSGGHVAPVALLVATAALIGLTAVRCHRLLVAADDARVEVERRERYFRMLATNSADAVVVLDGDGQVREGADKVLGLLGLEPADGTTVHPLAAVDMASGEALFARSLAAPGAVIEEELEVRRDGERSWWLAMRMVNLLDEPSVAGVVINIHDITDRKLAEQELSHRALHDSLTGLANRALFHDRVEHTLRRGARAATHAAVIAVNVDGFKGVNDRFGHDTGDGLLRELARRLEHTVRGSDTVARFGADEFAVLVEADHHAGEARTTADRILQALQAPVEIDGHRFAVSGSVGLALGDDTSTVETLLRNADIAMYRAKADGRGRVVVYDAAMGTEAVEAVQLRADLAEAVERGELELFHQPVVDLADGRITGFEALLRWRHPTLGLVPPDRFIPLAEQTGLIVPIGGWVLEAACAQAAAWAAGREGEPLTMAVNLSAVQLASDDIVDRVRSALERSGLAPSSLVLEMTETALVEDPAAAAGRLAALREVGVRLAIDDFGTGYSSLSYLRQFPIDILKIDRSFVDSITEEDRIPPIVRGLVRLGHTLELEIVAEGIETEVQRAWLHREQCTLGQGYLFSRPLPAAEAGRLLDAPALVTPA